MAIRSGLSFPATARALVRAAEERERRLREDLQLEPGRAMLHVEDVELDPLVPRERRAAVHLCPAGDPRLHLETARLVRSVPLHLVAERGPGADHAHLAADDVPELRQLVERQLSQDAADPGDARVA